MLESPFAYEGLAAGGDLLGRRRVEYAVVIRGDRVIRPLGRVRKQVLALWTVLRWTGTPCQTKTMAFSSPSAPSTMRNSGPRSRRVIRAFDVAITSLNTISLAVVDDIDPFVRMVRGLAHRAG